MDGGAVKRLRSKQLLVDFKSRIKTLSGMSLVILSFWMPATSFAENSFCPTNDQAHRMAGNPINPTINVPSLSWGKIVDTPSGTKKYYGERDLVYIKIADTKRGLIREGDRFCIINETRHSNDLNHRVVGSNSQGRILGQIEITSVGCDLIMGIILDCGSSIIKGSEIAPISLPEPSHFSDADLFLSIDGHTS
ncbi:MAG: hypothetical protein WC647_03620 [Desulfomonilaceae bacterium]|jgi:hypothetical protein